MIRSGHLPDGNPGPRSVAVLAYDGVSPFELGIALEVFGLPGMPPPWYSVAVCAERPGTPLQATGLLKLVADVGFSFLLKADIVIVPGWEYVPDTPPAPLLEALRAAHARGARIASICNGVFVLAAAGLLRGRQAAVHWGMADELKLLYPEVRVDSRVLYVDDGDILTSAGRAAGLDLCIHIIRRDYGSKVANDAARRLVMPAHREGMQAQFIPDPVSDEGAPLAELRAWMRHNLGEDLTIETLAGRAGMSRRTFIRHFEAATGLPPGEWVLRERTTRARSLLEGTDLSVEDIATTVGFGSADALRHHFRERLATSPARYRAGFRAPPAA